MRIALVAPLWETTPPRAYGGIERMVAWLADGLVARGHRVTLFATGDSHTTATLRAIEASPLRGRGLDAWCERAAEVRHLALALAAVRAGFDVVHNHHGYSGAAMGELAGVRMVTTLHGPVPAAHGPYYASFPAHPYVSISDAQRSACPGLRYVATVHNGIDTRHLTPGGRSHGYVLFLGRIAEEKGTHLAIAAAHQAGLPLVLAAKVDPADRAYFEQHVAPAIDGSAVRYVGEVAGTAKRDLLRGALALLHLVQFEEPFGLVMAEALACGTPVIGTPRGAVPEVVREGVTGFLVRDAAQAAAALSRLDTIDRAACRADAVARFDVARMVDGYEAVYADLARASVTIRRRRGAALR